jgi:threonylcarbamoyladenosine tRNA methylthiotransferase MtaB
MKKTRIVTLGCRTNQYESQLFSDQLHQLGYASAQEGEEGVELCIVNTCTVTDHADSSSRYQIRKLARQYSKARIVVTGCMAESAPEVIRSIDPRIELIPNQSKETLVATLFPEESIPELQIQQFEGHTRAFVKIQDGCNSFCTYCIIPYVRGRSVSRPVAQILAEVKTLVSHGYQEIVLTGINIGDFEADGVRLAGLVRQVDQIEEVKRLRISSIDPDEVDDDLLDAVIQGRATCPSMHLVLQSGSNVILKRMNRKYTRQIFMQTVERLLKAEPDFTVTTDIIVGFPGETEADFQETLNVVQDVRFAKVHLFPYSPRKRTRAALYPNRIQPDVMRDRKNRLLRLTEQAAFLLRQGFVGRTMEVLLEEGTDEMLSGHTSNFLRVQVPREGVRANQFVSVTLRENRPEGLIA